jgi:hypothetical protein
MSTTADQFTHPVYNFVTSLIFFYCEMIVPHPTPKIEDYPLSAVCDCLLSIFAAAHRLWIFNWCELIRNLAFLLRGPFEKFADSPYYSESELFGGAVMVSSSKYLPWQTLHFLRRSTHFSKTCCRQFAASFRRIVEQAVLTFHVRFSVSEAFPPFENRSSLIASSP